MARWALAYLIALWFIACALSPAWAGTTGILRGRVTDSVSRAPLAGVAVSVVSPSQAAQAVSDAAGGFSFLSLAPDTYVVSLTKSGYDLATISGITVVSDQTQNLTFELRKTLRTIGQVRARSTSDVVRPGATSDVYSINAATQKAASAVGGPGGVDYGYSGLATVPGLYILQGQQGWQQLISVRGGDPGNVAVELDGIPMARSSDGGTASTLSSLGQQELQAYTGGTPASADANGLSGYINQVMRTGTYPGFATATLGLGSPVFYNKGSIEIGGATTNRDFSYFVATSAVNQDYRYCGQDNCGGNLSHFFEPLAISGSTGPSTPLVPVYNGSGPANFSPGVVYALQNTADRETIANFHFGLPHRHSDLKDDIQALYVTSEIFAKFYSSIGDLGGLSYVTNVLGRPTYTDYNYYAGQVYAPPDPSQVRMAYFPSSPTQRPFAAPLPPNLREGNTNGVAVTKLQYQHNFNASSFLRIFGYTNYSNWFINGPVSEFFNYGGQIGDFEITEHAHGF
ncbi:MAG: carboxypeptidase regulatory-like domain-containing protein, partial [Candidatus Eremiobacteraeota bacterium]|nr:carboxypeptidase regulatory-like domain-containing protein [Candidatus Eremiobacteraeota bacterium]